MFDIFLNFFQNSFFSGCFDTSGSMIPLLVPEISPWGFCDGRTRMNKELGILVVRFAL